ncbi:hypothetical protein VNO77_26683 [Canavalia gladiata]|uniref:Uncharacterized protein n=1 Tax=Canavalia gladiata TaxID=3824 RepID=A0AAN9KVT1_CANGL
MKKGRTGLDHSNLRLKYLPKYIGDEDDSLERQLVVDDNEVGQTDIELETKLQEKAFTLITSIVHTSNNINEMRNNINGFTMMMKSKGETTLNACIWTSETKEKREPITFLCTQ